MGDEPPSLLYFQLLHHLYRLGCYKRTLVAVLKAIGRLSVHLRLSQYFSEEIFFLEEAQELLECKLRIQVLIIELTS